MKKIFCLMLALILSIGTISFVLPIATPKETYTLEPKTNYVTNSLHKVNVKESNRSFVVNGNTEYSLVVNNNIGQCGEAANFIAKHIAASTGAIVNIIPGEVSWNTNSKYIVMGRTDLFEQAGLTMPKDDLGVSGYYIKTVGNSVFIMTKEPHAWQHAGIAFLREVLGYDMLAEDCVIYEKDGTTLPDMEIIEKPDFDFKYEDNYITTSEVYGMGFLRQSQIFMPVNGRFVHNSLQYLQKSTYQSSYPEWYSTTGDQLCYTARGTNGEYDPNAPKYLAMIDAVYEVIRQKLIENPSVANITLTIEDSENACSCNACKKESTKYNTHSAAIIKFCNRVADKVKAYLEQQAQENGTSVREFNLVFFAYKKTEAPPVKLVNGKYEPIDNEVVCRDNVGVYIAPISAKYEKSFYESENADANAIISGWASCSKKLFFWLYDTNYRNYLYPYNSFDSLFETLRFCKASNAYMIVDEGQFNTTNSTAFNKLKIYLHAKGYFDVNADYNALIEKYFKYYFGDGGEPMLKMFKQVQAHMRYLLNTYPGVVTGGIYDSVEDPEFWPKALLDGWMNLLDEAYSNIEYLKESDSESYNSYKTHIDMESVFPRYALIQNHQAFFSSNEYLQMKLSFREDVTRLKITRYSEGGMMSSLWRKWNIG